LLDAVKRIDGVTVRNILSESDDVKGTDPVKSTTSAPRVTSATPNDLAR
jgi:hypothetical protein